MFLQLLPDLLQVIPAITNEEEILDQIPPQFGMPIIVGIFGVSKQQIDESNNQSNVWLVTDEFESFDGFPHQ